MIVIIVDVFSLFSEPFSLLITGSLLVGRTHAESDMLKGRVKQLSAAGLKAEYLCTSDLFKQEPDLLVEKESAAAFLPDDCQLDAHRTVAYIEKVLYYWFIFICNL